MDDDSWTRSLKSMQSCLKNPVSRFLMAEMAPCSSPAKTGCVEDLIQKSQQASKDCVLIASSLNTGPVTLSALGKECRAIADALCRLSDLSKARGADGLAIDASNNAYVASVSAEIDKLRAEIRRIQSPARDSGIDLGEPHVVIVWNEAALKASLNRLRTHQASLHTLLNVATRSTYKCAGGVLNRRRVIEPDAKVDEALRKLGRRLATPSRVFLVLPRVSDSTEIQVLLDTLVPPPNVSHVRTTRLAQQLHQAIEARDEELVFQLLLDRVDPNITLPGSMLSPLHRAFDQKHLLIVAFLVVSGADVDEPTIEGETALMRGIKCAFSEQFAELVIHFGARLDRVDNNGQTALHHSAASNALDDNSLAVIIKAGADTNAADYQGQTPLHVAIQKRRWNSALLLVQAGADLEVRLPEGQTALHLAIAMRNQEFTQILISRGAKINRALREHTPLTMAISSRCTAITAILIDSGADASLGSWNGNTPLLAAAATGHEETIRYLLAHGADVSAAQSQSGYTPMHMAAQKDRQAILQLLFESGAALNPTDNAGETPLLIAAKLGNIQSALRLVKLGADVQRVGADGMSVLSHAVKIGSVDLVKRILQRGGDLEPTRRHQNGDSNGYPMPQPQPQPQPQPSTSPLHVAAQHGRNEILMLLVNGASLESTVYPGRTPLSVAASHGHLSTVQLLLRLGANSQAVSATGDTVLFEASSNLATLKCILQQGVDVNHRNRRGATALHYAALRGQTAGVKYLLEKGARQFPGTVTWHGGNDGGESYQGTPADIARERGFDQLAEMIEKGKYKASVATPSANTKMALSQTGLVFGSETPAFGDALRDHTYLTTSWEIAPVTTCGAPDSSPVPHIAGCIDASNSPYILIHRHCHLSVLRPVHFLDVPPPNTPLRPKPGTTSFLRTYTRKEPPFLSLAPQPSRTSQFPTFAPAIKSAQMAASGTVTPAQANSGSWTAFLKSIASFNGDLSSLTAPPFILSSQSLTEFSAYWATHPPVLTAPAAESDPAARAMLVLKWFLSTLKHQYASRSEQFGNEKKPLNPFLGELFLGHWSDDAGKTTLVSEQVSHHPPATAYCIRNDKTGVRLEGYNAQKATFKSTIIVRQIGHAVLRIPLASGQEDSYLITLPNLHIEGLIFGAPFVELDGSSYIASSTGYTAKIDYSGRGWLSGKKNSITATITPTGKEKEVLYNVTGQWNKAFEIFKGPSKSNSKSTLVETYDAANTPQTELSVAPLEEQHPLESRRAWARVAEAIQKGDMDTTGIEKGKIEQAQRDMRAKERAENRSWDRQYFSAVEGTDEVLERLGDAAGVPKDGDADKTGGIWRFDKAKAEKQEAQTLSSDGVQKIEKELLGW